jgi:hypothetical protein
MSVLCAGIIALLFAGYAEGSLYDFILSFLPDVSMKTWSTIGLTMLAVQIFGNVTGVIFSFIRSEFAGKIALMLGGAEMVWMIFQFIILHIHNSLAFLFFSLSFAQVIMGYLINERLKELKKLA